MVTASSDGASSTGFWLHDNLFSQIFMTQPDAGNPRSVDRCLFRLVKCRATSLCTNQHGTHARRVKQEGRNLKKNKTQKYRGCCVYACHLRNIAVIATSLYPFTLISCSLNIYTYLYCMACKHLFFCDSFEF